MKAVVLALTILIIAPAAMAEAILVAAHRGGYANDAAEGAPENSVANVAVAIRKGFDLYETDIQRTRDGVFVIIHDATIRRETTGEGRVADLSLAELRLLHKRYRDGSISSERVATLEELLLAGNGRILFKPDLKFGLVAYIDDLARLIHRLGMVKDVILRCTYKEAMAIGKAFDTGTPKIELMVKVDTAEQVQKVYDRLSPRAIHVNHLNGEEFTSAKIEAVHAAVQLGMLVEMHTHNGPEEWQAFAEEGVRIFHTAVPDQVLRWLGEHGWR